MNKFRMMDRKKNSYRVFMHGTFPPTHKSTPIQKLAFSREPSLSAEFFIKCQSFCNRSSSSNRPKLMRVYGAEVAGEVIALSLPFLSDSKLLLYIHTRLKVLGQPLKKYDELSGIFGNSWRFLSEVYRDWFNLFIGKPWNSSQLLSRIHRKSTQEFIGIPLVNSPQFFSEVQWHFF